MKEEFKKLRHNHGLMMLTCCGVPLLLLLGAIYWFDISEKSYLFWFILLLCPAMHFWMMRDMRKSKSGENN